jgi:DNA-binding transcriptional LysR family regulator
VRRFQELENRLREIGSVVAGSIRVGTVYSVGLHELPPYLTEFLRKFPAVNVHLEYLRSNKIYEDLVEGKIDLGVVVYPAKRSQIVTVPFRYDELVLVVPTDSALARHSKVSIAQLSGQKFVGFERDIPTRKASDRILRDHGVRPQYALEFDNIETIKRAVEIGLGIAIVPRLAVENEAHRGSLKMLAAARDHLQARPRAFARGAQVRRGSHRRLRRRQRRAHRQERPRRQGRTSRACGARVRRLAPRARGEGREINLAARHARIF